MPLPENNGQSRVTIGEASAQLPEWLSLALHRAAARGRLSEKDALWGLLAANAELMRTYLDAEANGTKESIQKLEKQIQVLVRDIQYVKAPETRPSAVWRRIVLRTGISALLLSLAFLAGVMYTARQAEARVDRIIDAQPYANRAQLYLSAHQGAIDLGPLKPTEGHNETQGIFIYPGNLKLGEPWVSTDGITVAPIK